MGINRGHAEARLQAALRAWHQVSLVRGEHARGHREPNGGAFLTDAQLESLADGFDLMAVLWREIEDLRDRNEVAAHFLESKVEPGKVSITLAHKDGRAPTTLTMDPDDGDELALSIVDGCRQARVGSLPLRREAGGTNQSLKALPEGAKEPVPHEPTGFHEGGFRHG